MTLDEIEQKIACNEMTVSQVFTQMRQHIASRSEVIDERSKPAKDKIIDNIIMLHVFIHSSAKTGEPLSISVFEINGKINMQWFADALEPEWPSEQKELAEAFFEHSKKLDSSAWFLCKMLAEASDDTYLDCHVEVLSLIQ